MSIISIGDFFTANLDILNGQIPIPDEKKSPSPQAEISASAKVFAPVTVGSGSRIGDEAIILGPTAIGAHCQIEPGVVLNECVILNDARIGQGAYLHRCVVGDGGVVSSWQSLHEIAVMQTLESPPGQTVCSLREKANDNHELTKGPRKWLTLSGPCYLRVKRSLDAVLAILGLGIAAPLMLVITLLIRLDSPGDIIFRQERCGQGGRNFTMYKFRSMVANAEDLKREIMDLNEVDGPMFKIISDPRITRLGKILRDTNLDELPQLWNVLKGDMSLVGPRPLSMDEMRYNPKWRDVRLAVRPGMTGLWQVEAHTKVFFNEWLLNDLEYARRCSLGLDLQILLKTLKKTLGGLLVHNPQ